MFFSTARRLTVTSVGRAPMASSRTASAIVPAPRSVVTTAITRYSLAAATTWATSWTLAPDQMPNWVSLSCRGPWRSGSRIIVTVPGNRYAR